ncbi:MAG: coiled-coil domain-containing protein [Coriobacteriales bacterium]
MKVEPKTAAPSQWRSAFAAASLAFALTLACIPAAAWGSPATEAANNAVEQAETEVSRTADAYNKALDEQDRLEKEIAQLNSRIGQIEELLPAQEERSNESCVALYKLSGVDSSVIAVLLSARTFSEAISIIDSYNYIISQNVSQLVSTHQLKSELEQSRQKLEGDKQDADAAAQSAAQALEDAQAARKAAQERAAAVQAEEARAAAEAAAAAKKAASSKADKKKAEQEADQAAKDSENASISNVDWSASKQAFVSKWAPRINSYLAGSPTAGTGKAYAAAAWDYGVDPRWAPAISTVESSKGAACFASYNAWGYGGRSFSSWSDGIYTVVAALGSELYGGALTQAAAKTYCPPNWQSWYNSCAREMGKI